MFLLLIITITRKSNMYILPQIINIMPIRLRIIINILVAVTIKIIINIVVNITIMINTAINNMITSMITVINITTIQLNITQPLTFIKNHHHNTSMSKLKNNSQKSHHRPSHYHPHPYHHHPYHLFTHPFTTQNPQ